MSDHAQLTFTEIQRELEDGQRYAELPIGEIIAGQPGQNVRKHFNQEDLEGLAQSILDHGIIEPLIVRPTSAGYELVAGERRLRAAKMARLETVPVIIRMLAPSTAAKLQILENLQRRDIDPVEEAEGYQRLIDEHGLKARAIAQELGVSEGHISNRRRLLRLPLGIREEISCENLSASVALTLVDLAENPELASRAAAKLIESHSTQEHAPRVVAEIMVSTCPIVTSIGYVYGNQRRTCDETAHAECPCRRRVKSQYGSDVVVCIDEDRYKQVEAESQARADAVAAATLQKVEEKAVGGILDIKKLGWIDYGRGARYHTVTQPLGGSTCCADHSRCACLRKARGPYDDKNEVRMICIEPKQFNKLERQAKREQTKVAMTALQSENEQASTWALGEIENLSSEGLATILGPADLAYLAAWVFSSCDVYTGPTEAPRADRKKYLEALGISIKFPSSYLQNQRREIADAFLAQGTPETLLRIIYEWPLVAQGSARYALGHWYREQMDPEAANAEKADFDAAMDELGGDEDELHEENA